jgi:hypothetical protein
MSLMTPATHGFVDSKLREAADVREGAQRAAQPQGGHMNYEKALQIIYESRTLIDAETDPDRVIGHLEAAAVALGELHSANTPNVRLAIRAIGDTVNALKARTGKKLKPLI